MAFGKGRKKKKETAEELKARLKELEGEAEEETKETEEGSEEEKEEEQLPTGDEPPKDEKKKLPKEEKEEPKGNFNLSAEEMALAVNALAERPELKVYQDFIVGQQIAEIISRYNAAIPKDEKLPVGNEERSQE